MQRATATPSRTVDKSPSIINSRNLVAAAKTEAAVEFAAAAAVTVTLAVTEAAQILLSRYSRQ
jgi:hypothetical protein